MWLNLLELSNRILKPGQKIIAIKYFTTLIHEPESKVRRQRTYLSVLNSFPKNLFFIFEGRYQYNEIRCPNEQCGRIFLKPVEKKTDVCISVEMVRDAYTHLCDWEFLISADSDLAPAVEAEKKQVAMSLQYSLQVDIRLSNIKKQQQK